MTTLTLERLSRIVYRPLLSSVKRPESWLEETMLLCQNCRLCYRRSHCRHHNLLGEAEDWRAYKIPQKTIKIGCSTITFYKGCNRLRAGMLKEIVKAQTSKHKPDYPHDTPGSANHFDYPVSDQDTVFEVSIDGKKMLDMTAGDCAENKNVRAKLKEVMPKKAIKPTRQQVKRARLEAKGGRE